MAAAAREPSLHQPAVPIAVNVSVLTAATEAGGDSVGYTIASAYAFGVELSY